MGDWFEDTLRLGAPGARVGVKPKQLLYICENTDLRHPTHRKEGMGTDTLTYKEPKEKTENSILHFLRTIAT